MFARKRPRPDWAKWNACESLPLWQLCALSCDIDPDAIKIDDESERGDPELAEFFKRLRIAANAAAAGELGPPAGETR